MKQILIFILGLLIVPSRKISCLAMRRIKTEGVIRDLVDMAMAEIRDGKGLPECDSGDEAICAHVTDLALMLSAKTEVMGKNRLREISDFCDRCRENVKQAHNREYMVEYAKQYYYLNREAITKIGVSII